jgi:TPR repeat protein
MPLECVSRAPKSILAKLQANVEMPTMKTTTRLLAILFLMSASVAKGGEFEDLLAKAKEGDAVAQYGVGQKYSKGEGIAKDVSEAAKWLEKSAQQGNADAQIGLGALYLGGRGLPKNSVEAAKWYGLAAEQGRAPAQLQIARMHLAGTGVPADDVQAYKWARLALGQGDRQAHRILVFLKPKMTAVDIARAENLATEFLAEREAENAALGIPAVAPPLE